MAMHVIIQKHGDLSKKQLEDIVLLKEQHWPHGILSQKNWIAENFEENDIHLILYHQDAPVAYASLNQILCTIDSKQEPVLGLGSVCVARSCQKQGLGKVIVESANQYIAEHGKTGLLLCHKELTEFYSRYGWSNMNCEKVTVAEKNFVHFAMSLCKNYENVKHLVVPKNF